MARKSNVCAGKQWTYEDDSFLVAYFGAMGDFIGTHDLGRAEGEATKRVAFLKETGAWKVIARRERALKRAHIKAYEAEIEYFDEFDGKVCYVGERPWRDNPEAEV